MNKFVKRSIKVFVITTAVVVGIVIGSAVAVGIVNTLASKQTNGTTANNQPTYTRDELLVLTNKRRVEAGKNPLLLDETLNGTAQQKCEDMAAADVFEHEGLQDLSNRLGLHMGENLAEGYGSSKEVMDAWIASPSHHRNIIDPSFSHVGFGICDDDKLGPVVVQHFSN